MIFLRQKPYGNNRNSSNTRRQHRRVNRNRQINTNLNNQTNLTRQLNNSASSVDFIRSITINERLASIGGFFGVLSIVVTGALLYAVFTAKPNEKWYYIIAVLVNISLLVILMIAAILFDRLYIKKIPQRRIAVNNETSNRTNRVININPIFYPNTNRIISNNNNSNINQTNTVDYINMRNCNDIPPEYPGIINQSENQSITNHNPTNNKASNNVLISTISNEILLNQTQLSVLPNYLNTNETNQASPPDYFDLYPSSILIETSENVITNNNHNINANILPSGSLSNQSSALNTNNTNKETILQIEP